MSLNTDPTLTMERGQIWAYYVPDGLVHDTELSEICWKMKDGGLIPAVRFEVVCKAEPYNTRSKKCFLCLKEKIAILTALRDPENINRRSEIMGHCLHRDKSLLSSLNLRGYKPPDRTLQNVGQDRSLHQSFEDSSNDLEGSQDQNMGEGTSRLRSGNIWK